MKLDRDSCAKILDVIGALVIVMDSEGRIKFFNPACEELTGYKFEEVKDVLIWNILITEEEMNSVKNIFNELRSALFPNNYENYWKTKDGRLRLISWHNTAITDEDNNVMYIVGTGVDVTEKRQKEEEMLSTWRLLEGTIDAIPDIIGIQNPDYSIIRYNKAGYDFLGLDPQEVKGRKCYEFMDFGAPCSVCATRKARESKSLEKVEKYISDYDVYLDCRSNPVLDEEGEIEYIVEQLRDITDRKQAEEELKDREKELAAIYENAPLIMILVDEEVKVRRINGYTQSFSSKSPEEIMGERPGEILRCIYAFDDPRGCGYGSECMECRVRQTVARTFEKGTFHDQVEVSRFVKIDGEAYKKFFLLSTSRLYIKKKPMVLVSLMDITERKVAEERIWHLSFYDRLTGLYNRAYLEEEMKRLDVKRQLPLSVIMADVNGLKLVNDTYGHESGDRLLQKAGQVLHRATRREDIVARSGGDEFMVFLPGTAKEQAEKIVKRIKEECSKFQVESIPVQMAVGTSTKENTETPLSQVIKEAEDYMYKSKLTEGHNVRSDIISALLGTLKEKSDETEEHAWRMTNLGYIFGEELDLSAEEIDRLSLIATMHDVGKVLISEEILKKPGPLNEKEWQKIKEHPEIGRRIALASENLAHVAKDISAHHERWDGRGYPNGLKGEEIPLLARMIAIIDSYDVMTNDRSYKEAISKEEALKEIEDCAGIQFDPKLAKIFVKLMGE